MIKAYMESGYRLKPMIVDGKPLIEFWYKLQLEGVCINMKLDIVTENEAVVDYKTTSKKYKQTEADNLFNEKGLQLSLYTIAYYQMFGRLPKKVGFQVIGKGEEMILQNIARKTPFTETDMENVIMFFLSKVEEAESDTVFEPSFSKCFFCSFKDRCYHER
jgi:CRISPR/Cas system-associated exonuclease Cas4 (RecB family)